MTVSIELSPRKTKLLRELVHGSMESLTQLPAYDKLESCYQEEYAELRQLAEQLGAKVGRLPKQLKATAKEAAEARAAHEAHMEDLRRGTFLPRWMRAAKSVAA
jgi:hypothetical protein